MSSAPAAAKYGIIALRNQLASPFLRLSSEIRNIIYLHVLYVGTVSMEKLWRNNHPVPHLFQFEHSKRDDTVYEHDISGLFVLSKICRQIRSDTRGMTNPSNSFAIGDSNLRNEPFILQQLPIHVLTIITELTLGLMKDKPNKKWVRRLDRLPSLKKLEITPWDWDSFEQKRDMYQTWKRIIAE